MTELKILVCGDVNGNFKTLFSKVDAILKKKGAFEYLFCVGNFFGENSAEWEDLKSGKIKVPLTTYILGANEKSHEDFFNSLSSVPNIIHLGKKGCLTGTSGLKIAYLSGVEFPERRGISEKNNGSSIYFSRKDVNEMISSLESETVIDVLLTSQWPKGITKYAISPDKNEYAVDTCSSYLVSRLAKALKPRYHFCGLAGLYYERVPYRNHAVLQETAVHVTRFFALAPVNNTQKQKWLYAFNIVPASCLSFKQLTEISGPATVCPYESDGKQEMLEKSKDQFFFDTSSSNNSGKRSQNDKFQSPPKKPAIDSSTCWFCLTNKEVEKQLIISIGEHCYITLPKGLLVPEHVLIVPIKHALSSVELSDDVSEEVEKFKKALASYFHDKNKDVVFFERNYSSPHLQIQVVPVPKHKKNEIQDELLKSANHFNLEFHELSISSQIDQVVQQKKPYFYFELVVDRKTEAKYLHIINKKFPLQYGRIVLASKQVLDVENRIDWRDCQDSKSVEKEAAEKMKRNFAPYDFTE